MQSIAAPCKAGDVSRRYSLPRRPFATVGVAGSRPSFARLAQSGRSSPASPVSCSSIREPLRVVTRRGFPFVATACCLVPRGCRLVSPKSRKLRFVYSSRSTCAWTRSVSFGFAYLSCDQPSERSCLRPSRGAKVSLASWSSEASRTLFEIVVPIYSI